MSLSPNMSRTHPRLKPPSSPPTAHRAVPHVCSPSISCLSLVICSGLCLTHLSTTMPPLPCVARAARSTNSLRTLSFSHSPTTPVRSLSSTASRRAGHSEESPYDPPSGNLFGVPPGEKYQNEGWERLWVWGFWGTCGLATVAYCFKPDTS